MMYNFMTLNDGTGIAHSETIQKDGKEQVKVYFEQPVEKASIQQNAGYLLIHGLKKKDFLISNWNIFRNF